MDIQKIINSYMTKPALSPSTESASGFEEILNQKITEANPAVSTTASDEKNAVLSIGDRILGLLDGYAADLADPAKSMKDIEPIVRSIEREVSQIEAQPAECLQDDAVLQKIVRDLTVTANVAVLKFDRGDYI